MYKFVVILVSLFFSQFPLQAQQAQEKPYTDQWTLAFGMSQPLFLNGFNVAINYTTQRWVFEYSHGMNLNYSGPALRTEYQDQLLSLRSPYSTGAGFGPRLIARPIISMDLRLEAKVHQYNAELNEQQELQYTNFDLGAGIYWQIRPFGKTGGLLKGITLEPSIRYWANVASSLEKNFSYTNPAGETVGHTPYPLNLFGNLSLAYTFPGRR